MYFLMHGASNLRSTSVASLAPMIKVPKPATIMVVKAPNAVYHMYEMRYKAKGSLQKTIEN